MIAIYTNLSCRDQILSPHKETNTPNILPSSQAWKQNIQEIGWLLEELHVIESLNLG